MILEVGLVLSVEAAMSSNGNTALEQMGLWCAIVLAMQGLQGFVASNMCR